ncbi:MAG: glutamate--cysteine ligase [Pseudomonadota bacterium]
MSTRQETDTGEAIQSRDELVGWIAAGEKPADAWRIGTEHEKFVFRLSDNSPVSYKGEAGICALMAGLMDCCGWQAIEENGNIIALKRAPGAPGGNVSLEPGGQFELSGAPLRTVHETAVETAEHLRQCHRAGDALGLGFMGLGVSPVWSLDETPMMPKARYGVMKSYMPKVGTRGLDMMFRTATIQVNLDFASEADLVKKLRVSMALQPVATSLFANSPFLDGTTNGFKSLRSEIWRHTDNNRTGILGFVFDQGMGYEAYVDYALRVPMYFVYRDGQYIDVAGASFVDFMEGRLPGLEGERPTIDDWSDHLTTLFPEVRVKRFMEMRGADGGSEEMIAALPAFWAGLLYDSEALDAALALVSDLSVDDVQALRDDVPRHGLQTPLKTTGASPHRTVLDLARAAVEIARSGLERRACLNGLGEDETKFLEPLQRCVDQGMSSADRLLQKYRTQWKGDMTEVFKATEM